MGAKFIHFGATSQDVVDTATMLQVRDAVLIIDKNVAVLIQQLVFLIENHRNTLMIGRSFMQQAKPITFSFKAATWLDGLLRSKKRLGNLLNTHFTLQLGGAVGKLIFAENVSLALSAIIGKAAAHHLVEATCKTAVSTKKHLKIVLKADKTIAQNLSSEELEACFDPKNSLGLCDVLIDKVLNLT